MNFLKLGFSEEQIKKIKKGDFLGFTKGVTKSEYKHLKKIAKKGNFTTVNFAIRTGIFELKNYEKETIDSFIKERKYLEESDEVIIHYFEKRDRWKVKKMIAEIDKEMIK